MGSVYTYTRARWEKMRTSASVLERDRWGARMCNHIGCSDLGLRYSRTDVTRSIVDQSSDQSYQSPWTDMVAEKLLIFQLIRQSKLIFSPSLSLSFVSRRALHITFTSSCLTSCPSLNFISSSRVNSLTHTVRDQYLYDSSLTNMNVLSKPILCQINPFAQKTFSSWLSLYIISSHLLSKDHLAWSMGWAWSQDWWNGLMTLTSARFTHLSIIKRLIM